MSSEYSNDLKIHEIEPVYFSVNNRAEFRLPPNRLYTNTMNLMNLGVTKSADGGFLNRLVGVYGSLSRIALMDGNVELQSLTRANEWLGIKQHLHSNRYNENLGYNYAGNHKSVRIGLRDISSKQIPFTGTAEDVAKKRGGANGRKIIEGGERDFNGAVTSDANTTYKGQLDISECLNFIQSIPYVDTSIFKNLKLVIEFDVTMRNIHANNQDTGTLTQLRPYLVVEEIVAPDILAGSLGKTPPAISYNVIESDVFTVPAIIPNNGDKNPVQPLTFHVSSFNNKRVNRLIMATRCNVATAATAVAQQNNADCAMGIYNSHAMFRQKNQIRLNGRNVFARNGIERDMQRLALMADVWGGTAGIAPFYAGMAPLAENENIRQDILDQGNEVIGTQDYFGCTLAGVKVEDLQLDYERTGTANDNGGAQTILSKYNADLSLHIFAEVKKAVVFGKSGQYNVVYQ